MKLKNIRNENVQVDVGLELNADFQDSTKIVYWKVNRQQKKGEKKEWENSTCCQPWQQTALNFSNP